MNAGYSTGWCEESFAVHLEAREIACRACGDPWCRFIMAPPQALENHIETYFENHPEMERRSPRLRRSNFFSSSVLETLTGQAGDGEPVYGTIEQQLIDYSRKLEATSELLKAKIGQLEIEVKERQKAENEIRRLNKELEQRVEDRTAELVAVQNELIVSAHKAGMAEIATSVIHNVGNILTSVTTSSQLIRSQLESSTINSLVRANGMLRENMDRIDDFVANDPKGKQLLQFYLQLETYFRREHEYIAGTLDRLLEQIDAIRAVIMTQQDFASSGPTLQECTLARMVEDGLRLMGTTFLRRGIRIIKKFEVNPVIRVQRVKMIHVIINLLKNAAEAMGDLDAGSEEKTVTIMTQAVQGHALLKIIDGGEGISMENLEKIFNYGFTTKKAGHGFGLHGSVHSIAEMGGCLWAESAGIGQGATFVVKIPVIEKDS